MHYRNIATAVGIFNACKKLSRELSGSSRDKDVVITRLRRSVTGARNSRHYAAMTDSGKKNVNRLALEKSPYLLQHATNPVDWYPWGEEAFSKAVKENKLIFLSVGYSTCHWCHVMERESFENEEIAKIMNENFVCIKVDREERPDVDKLYMVYVQVNRGRGGWPLSVWLTPNLQPVYGGTYFPPNDFHELPGFRSVLMIIAKQWRENRQKFSESGQKMMDFIEKSCTLDSTVLNPASANPPPASCYESCFRLLLENHEEKFGGFSRAPKFPHLVNLNFLFHLHSREPKSEMGKKALDMCLHQLKMMADGGIHDHIGQGFSRYSVDERWHVPHFEKMLYDQGQLAVSYASAFLATKNPFFADVLKGILTYVSRDLSHSDGGFFSAEDADSLPALESTEKREGAFYVWTHDEIKRLLGRSVAEKPGLTFADVFCAHFGVRPEGNVAPSKDPHKELVGQNVLLVVEDEAATAKRFNLSEDRTKQILNESKKILFEWRSKRPRPQLDDKILTGWNGLMISGFAKGGQALANCNYVQRAVGAAKFVRQYLYRNDTKTLLRSCYKADDDSIGQIANPIGGFLTDYAFLIRGLLDLYEASFDPTWIEWAESLQESQDKLFWDEGSAGYFSSPSGDSSILVRMKEDHDGAEPSGNSVSAQNLLRLEAFLHRLDFRERAEKLLAAFTSRLNKTPVILPEMVSALLFYHDGPTQILITGKVDDPDAAALLNVVQSRLIPNRVLTLVSEDKNSILYRKNDIIRTIKSVRGQPTAYVCHHHTCSLPVNTREELSKLLDRSK